jgi:hypothetical protein
MLAPHLPVGRLVALSYSDVWRALRAMPLLIGCAVLIFLAVHVVEQLLPARTWNGAVNGTLAGILENAVQYFCVVPVMIAIHRFIVRGDVTRSYTVDLTDRTFVLFFAWTMAISVLFSLALAFGETLITYGRTGAISPFAALIPVLITLIAVFWLALRLIVLFPAIAVGAPGAKAGNAFADTNGYILRLTAIFLLAFIPLIAVAVLITLALGRGVMLHGSALSVIYVVFSAVLGTIVEALGVVIASHIYLAIGRKVWG